MINAYLIAIVASFFWGAGFIGSRFGLEAYSPMWVTFLRFFVGFIAGLFLIKKYNKNDLSFKIISSAFVSALMLAIVMFLQIKGLNYTTVAKSGFITILYAFFTPILYKIFYKQKLSNYYWTLLVVALFGMFLIADMNVNNFNYGDLLTLICAVFSSFHILSIGKFSKHINNFAIFNMFQLLFVSLITLPFAIYEGTETINLSFMLQNQNAVWGIVFMGVFSTSLGFLMQCQTQSKLAPHIASLIFLLESPFAAILAFVIFRETLSFMAICGSAVVILAVGLISIESKVKDKFERINVNFNLGKKKKRIANSF